MPVFKAVNQKFFDTWTHEMAYVLGFMMADGSMDVNPRGSRYFSIQITERMLLEHIRLVLGSEHTIGRRTGVGNEKDRFRLQVGSKYMCGQLCKLGMHSKKAHTMSMPPVPRMYIGDFVRGYFDGDGNVWVGLTHKKRKTSTKVIHTTFSSCSVRFLMALRIELQKHGLGSGSLIFSRKAFRLQYSVNDSILLYQLMYRGVLGGLELPQKRRVFEGYIAMRS